MQSFHIHIKGIVQGVGFRPLVAQLASSMQLNGWVCNDVDGLHIEITTSEQNAHAFYHHLLQHPPRNATITQYQIREIPLQDFSGFSILQHRTAQEPDLLLTPDIALCADCREGLFCRYR